MPDSARLPQSELHGRLGALRDAMLSGLVERDAPIRLALLAALAGEHILLVGPPGTAKSLVARRLHLAFEEASYFERLLTRFSVPEELFGPLSIKGLEEDRYERLTEAYLPRASIAFLDEIFKANSAILNALLTLLNEREFDNGTRRDAAPLIAAIGASNELPKGEELDALFDRFLLRVHVGPVSKAAFASLLGLRGESRVEVPPRLRLTPNDVEEIRSATQSVVVPDDVVALLSDLREWCVVEKIQVSDRRWRKIVKLLQTSAFTNGRDAVSVWDCWLLQHCIWNDPEQRQKVYDWYAERAGTSAALDPSRLTRMVVVWEGKLKADEESRSQARDVEGRPLFKGPTGAPTPSARASAQKLRDGEVLYLSPPGAMELAYHQYQTLKDRTNAGKGYTQKELQGLYVANSGRGTERFENWSARDAYLANEQSRLTEDVALQPLLEQTPQPPAHVEACLKEIDGILQRVFDYKVKLDTHIATLRADIEGHLWVPGEFAEPAARSLDGTLREVETLRGRLVRLRTGFELLPRAHVPNMHLNDGAEGAGG